MKKKMNNKGFSLVELIVVITILGVLVGIAIPQFLGYVDRTKRNSDVKNAQEIATVLMAEIADNATTVAALLGGGSAVKTAKVEDALLGGKMKAPSVKLKSGEFFWATYKQDVSELKILVGAAATGAKELYPNVDASYK